MEVFHHRILILKKMDITYLRPGDGVLKSGELGNQLGGLVLLTYRSILQIRNMLISTQRSKEV